MEQLDKAMYADELSRRYLINTAENTSESFKQASYTGDIKRPDIAEKFQKAAAFYGLELKTGDTDENTAVKEADIFDLDNGQLCIGKMATVDDVVRAGSLICDMRKDHTRGSLKEAALHVLSAASSMDADLDTDILRKIAHIAGVGVGDRAEIEHEFEKRATLNDFAGSNAAFWEAVNDIKTLSDDDFYKQANLEYICNTLEDVDTYFNNSHRYSTDMKAPEDVVFSSTADDLLKEASDLMYVEAADATLSKKALLERSDAINSFYKQHFNVKNDMTGAEIIEKVASCDKITFDALISAIEG